MTLCRGSCTAVSGGRHLILRDVGPTNSAHATRGTSLRWHFALQNNRNHTGLEPSHVLYGACNPLWMLRCLAADGCCQGLWLALRCVPFLFPSCCAALLHINSSAAVAAAAVRCALYEYMALPLLALSFHCHSRAAEDLHGPLLLRPPPRCCRCHHRTPFKRPSICRCHTAWMWWDKMHDVIYIYLRQYI